MKDNTISMINYAAHIRRVKRANRDIEVILERHVKNLVATYSIDAVNQALVSLKYKNKARKRAA